MQAFPGPGARWTISTEGGTGPVWSYDGTELFYRQGNRLMVVAIESHDDLGFSRPEILFEGQWVPTSSFGAPNYDVSPDGRRFVMVRDPETVRQTRVRAVLDWRTELERLGADR